MIKVLIVEDDPMVATLNEQYVNLVPDFKCVGNAGNIDTAMRLLTEIKADLILLDIFMLKRSGFELMRHLRERDISADVIFITAARDRESIERAMRFGAVDYLIKPFTFERFQEALISYQKRNHLICSLNDVSQETLDGFLFKKDVSLKKSLPKGLTSKTFFNVWETINSFQGTAFTADDLVKAMDLSRVSIRKYLHFLEDEGILTVETKYGELGRPSTKYQVGEISEKMLDVYR